VRGTVQVDVSGAGRAFAAMQARGANPAGLFRGLKRELHADLLDHFAAREGTDGRWPAWSTGHTSRRLARGGLRKLRGGKLGPRALTKRGERKLRNMLGRLKAAWDARVSRDSLVFESRVPWSGAHQRGATVGRGAVLPARPFMYASWEFVRHCARMLEAWVADPLDPVFAARKRARARR
jgi:hypothetical protein